MTVSQSKHEDYGRKKRAFEARTVKVTDICATESESRTNEASYKRATLNNNNKPKQMQGAIISNTLHYKNAG